MIEDALSLWDYRRRVDAMYRKVRDDGASDASWQRWRTERDALFSTHPQSPVGIGRRERYGALPFFPYDPAWRIEGLIETSEPVDLTAGHSDDRITPLVRFGSVAFGTPEIGESVRLSLYWIDVYGGGVFLPFRDATNGDSTYGGGRYLLDTMKGADLGSVGDTVVLDFNFAYHPSCVHDDRWSCPLAPPENRMAIAVVAGERLG